MNQRLKQLRSALGMTQQEFADKLGVKRGAIANYELGRNEPIDAVVALICKTFNVNEQWLRTGEGEMLVQLSPSEELAAFTAQLQREDSFRRRFIAALSTLDPDAWDYVERFMRQLIEENKEKTDL